MKYLLIIFLFLSPSLSWSKDVSRDDLVKRDGLFYEKFTDVPFTGNVTGKKQGKIIEGKPVGEFLTYYESGQLKEKINYKDGKKEGERILYYESGQLKDKINYKDGALEGERLEYFEIGQLKEKVNYKDGKKEGEGLWYYENGQLEEKVNYKEGVKNKCG